ncbi:hypothetical protein BO70DRAFT_395752 [Aspergillus heteromorphus CBS 117.55]|uniref:Uncharacterized protein n=1 Tax=Aspergillus heteromorphus CBS 117.55 TaxID=1448321 RepID=A0A317WIH4_9EURO|nr:uncharacterized protein BO70DRAFT_395752 [Aspergillus heteromorphus CBS 117.55]PWY85082.1 hypothetical protein BO70DRAFT_395752 [Aspergillus heteromorphus CBS 117.55]
MDIVGDDFPLPRTDYQNLYLSDDVVLQEECPRGRQSNDPVCKKPIRLMETPKTIMYIPCNELHDMDIYILIPNLDSNRTPMLSLDIPRQVGMWMGIDHAAGQGLQVQVWNPQMYLHQGLDGSALNDLNRPYIISIVALDMPVV